LQRGQYTVNLLAAGAGSRSAAPSRREAKERTAHVLETGQPAPHARDLVEIDPRLDESLALVEPRRDDAPRIDDDALAVGLAPFVVLSQCDSRR
jgi:hypothetical protein